MKAPSKKLALPFHIVKRSAMPIWQSLLIRVLAVLSAVLLCTFLSIFMIGINPIRFIATMFYGAFGTTDKIWIFAKDAAVLLCIALAITPAFRMRFWNIGAEGQTLVGALAAVAVVIYAKKLPTGIIVPEALLWALMLVAALLAGAVWGGLPALFKSLWGTNETLFTLMMNYVASGLVVLLIAIWVPSGSGVVQRLSFGSFSDLLTKNYHVAYAILIAAVLLLTVGIFIYQKYTKHGYEISVVGESENTAKYVGINVKKVTIRTMLISGAICGFAGFLIVSLLDQSVAATTVGGRGFTAIMVSWLAKFNPLIMLGTSSLLIFLKNGAAALTETSGVNQSFPDAVMGIVLFFIIGCEFFIGYQIKPKKSKITRYSLPLPVHILLLALTAGIWKYIWIFRATEFTNHGTEKKERDALDAVFLHLFFIFVPFYRYVWIFQTAKRIDRMAKERGIRSRLSSPLLILFFAVPAVAFVMMQIKMNAIIKSIRQNSTEGGNA